MLDVSALGVSGAGFLFGVGVSLYFDVASLGGSHAGCVGCVCSLSVLNLTRFFLLHLFTCFCLLVSEGWFESALFRVMAPTASASAADTIVSLSRSGVTKQSMVVVLPLYVPFSWSTPHTCSSWSPAACSRSPSRFGWYLI